MQSSVFYFPHCRNETEVESKLIVDFLLPRLGYTPHTWHQQVAFGRIRLDFLVFAVNRAPLRLADNQPVSLVIEAKSPQHGLDRFEGKLREYLTKLRIGHGVLTNGKDFRVYGRDKDSVRLLFRCPGEAIEQSLPQIRELIGREALIALSSSEPVLLDSVQEVDDLPSLRVVPIPASTEGIPETQGLSNVSSLEYSVIREDSSMIIIAIYHNKGGVGKSTVAVNTAAGFSSQGYRVLLIDLDAQANSTFATGLIKYQFDEDSDLKDRNISHIIESEDLYPIDEIKRRSVNFSNPEIDVIPSHLSLIEKIYKLNQKQVVCFLCLHSKLQAVKDQYDLVIIDTPPSRDLYAQVALVVSDYLIIPSDMKAFSNQGLNNVKSFISELDAPRKFISKKPLEILGVLPSKILTQNQYFKYTFPKEVQTVIDRYGLPVFSNPIFQRTDLSKCLNNEIEVGNLRIPDPKSIFLFDPGCDSSKEFLNLINEVSDKIGL